MKRIIIHWTAGTNKPNATDLEHYHFVIDGEGKVHKGKFTPEDNLNCYDGKYARHTGQGNTGSIGVSMCGMFGFNTMDNKTKYPLTRVQMESCFKFCAELAIKYNIPLDDKHIYTHYTFNKEHNIKTGKIDIVYMPPFEHVKKDDVISFIISKIRWYFKNLKERR